MKKTAFLSLLISPLFFLSSCQKESASPDEDYYIEAKIDGSKKVYSANSSAALVNLTGGASLSIEAYLSHSSIEGFTFLIAQDNPITTGIYMMDESGNDLVGGAFNPGGTNYESLYFTGSAEGGDNPIQIEITELTDTNVSGTFNGIFRNNRGAGPGSIVVTEGRFNLPIH